MNIGIYDQDALLYKRNFVPNLEAMKISSYFKFNKHFVNLILNGNYEKYSKVFLFKEKEDKHFPSLLISNDKVTYGGAAFSNGKYISIFPEAENFRPDYLLYNKYIKKYLPLSKKQEERLSAYERASFIRLSSNGINCNNKIENCFCGPSIFIYDNNLENISGSYKKIDDIDINNKTIYILKPVFLDDLDTAVMWTSSKWLNAHDEKVNKIIYNKNTTLKEFKSICQISNDFKVPLNLIFGISRENTSSDNFLNLDFELTLNKMFYAITTRSKIRFISNKNISNPKYKLLFSELERWFNNYYYRKSFQEYCNNKKNILKIIKYPSNDLKTLLNNSPKKIRDKGVKWNI